MPSYDCSDECDGSSELFTKVTRNVNYICEVKWMV